MIEIETSLRRWGNSYGVVIPKEAVRRAGISVDQPLTLMLKPKRSLRVRDIYGKLPDWKGSTEKILAEADRELASRLG